MATRPDGATARARPRLLPRFLERKLPGVEVEIAYPTYELRRRPLHPRPLPRSARPAQRLARRPPADPDAVGDRRRRPGGADLRRGLRVGDDPADRVALHRRPDAARHPRPAERLPRRAAGRAAGLDPGRPVRGAERLAAELRDRGVGDGAEPLPSEEHFDAVVRDEAARQAREQPLVRPARLAAALPGADRDLAQRPLRAGARGLRPGRREPRLGRAGSEQIVFAHTHQPLADVRVQPATAGSATGTPAPGSTSPTSARARPTPATCATPGRGPRS